LALELTVGLVGLVVSLEVSGSASGVLFFERRRL